MSKLHIVPTPIGNLQDITYRAVEILSNVDLILAEDTRVSQKLLEHYNIRTRMVSYHMHNEHKIKNDVIENLNNEEGYNLNKRFFKNQESGLPYIILKWAQTEDGFIAKEDGSSKWISNDISRMLVHKWRSEEPGILIGVNTANKDNPRSVSYTHLTLPAKRIE